MQFRTMPILWLALSVSASPAGEVSPLRLVRTIPLPAVEGRIDHLAVDLAGQRLFVAALGNQSLEVLDLKAGKALHTIRGLEEPQGVAYLPATDRIVVACGGDGTCRIFDGKSYRPVRSIDCRSDADNVRYDAVRRRIYVGYGKGGLAAIDAQTYESLAQVPLAGHPESFQLESKGPRVFVNVPGARQIAVVDRQQNAVVAVWPVGDVANFPMAFDEAHQRLFVGCRKPAQLLAIDAATGKRVATVATVDDADDVFYDARARRLYVSGGGGAISVVQQRDADHYEPLATVATRDGARTALFEPTTARLFLAVPHRAKQPAEIREYRTAGE